MAQLLVLSKLVNPDTNCITIIADAAQRIYKTGFTWSDVGINVRGGRSIELKRNYRNTRQIANAALSLLSNDPHQTDFSDHELPDREGQKPTIHRLSGEEAQTALLIDALGAIDLKQKSAVVLHRNRKGRAELEAALQQAEFEPTSIIATSTEHIGSCGLYPAQCLQLRAWNLTTFLSVD